MTPQSWLSGEHRAVLDPEARVASILVPGERDARPGGQEVVPAATPDDLLDQDRHVLAEVDEVVMDPVADRVGVQRARGLGDAVAEALGERAGRKVRIASRVRGERSRWLDMARETLTAALKLDPELEQAQEALENLG